jgi:U4/U6.U5 tri-snRNP-associated protein 2
VQFYVLPEGYPVSDPSLNDILAVLSPKFTTASLPALSRLPPTAYSLTNQPFTPGYIGINNVAHHSHLNVIIHLLLHIPPIRTFFLSLVTPPTELVARLATLARRLWNSKLFKAQVSPHEFLQEVNKRSAGRFSMSQQGDPVEFLGWLLNTLHKDLGGTKKRGSSVIYQALQGMVRIETQQIVIHKEYSRPVFDIARGRFKF